MTGRTARLPAALAFIVGGLGACAPPDTSQAIEFRVPVSVREVVTGTVEDRIIATGTLRAPETVALRAETTGSLRCGRHASGRRLAEGDRVKAGQMLAEVTGADVELAARSEATRTRYQTAARDYESSKRLFDEGLLGELELRRVEASLAEAKVEWERSQLTESRSHLVTPISGVILRLARDEQDLPIADGQLVRQGQLLVQVAPTARLVADVDLVGPDVSRVKVGLPARVRHHAWESRRFEGELLRLAPSINPIKRTLRAEVRVDNSERLLRPGMFVEVTLVAEERRDVAVVPRESVTERGGSKVVFLLNGQRAAKRAVVLGLGDDDIVEVREGVEVGDRVVVRGLETLTDGTRVRVSGG